jgi:hypothetical protein
MGNVNGYGPALPVQVNVAVNVCVVTVARPKTGRKSGSRQTARILFMIILLLRSVSGKGAQFLFADAGLPIITSSAIGM